MYILQLKGTATLYYGTLTEPFYVFQDKDAAETYISGHNLGRAWEAVWASADLIRNYFMASF